MKDEQENRQKIGEGRKAQPREMPHCCSCGKSLPRLPGSKSSCAARVYQCAECFSAGAAGSVRRSEAVASERSRWLEGFARDR